MNLLEEQSLIKKGLLYFWNCKACHKLGWDKECKADKKRPDCNFYVYSKLREHFKRLDR